MGVKQCEIDKIGKTGKIGTTQSSSVEPSITLPKINLQCIVKEKTPTQTFSFKLCKIILDVFFTEQLWSTHSENPGYIRNFFIDLFKC